ncbi:MAG TPA: bifunctional molybdenum cofactor biosynthesis protein MoaC/MoaB [Gammaproteobacteria bacterium]|nr:bifunctional molybdenum cofactor biosynthesis protein MoaC/MoaB [Gammaproteobacteria bacterium]
MKDVTSKPETLRTARATATIHCPEFCVPLLRERRTEKGDALEAARVAGIMAAKRTPDLIPLCHPLPLLAVKVEFELQQAAVTVESEVQLIAATGAEMEALTAVSVAGLTLYDMLKPHAGTDLSIDDVHLLEKRGGKSQYHRRIEPPIRAAVIVLSDTVAAGRKKDSAGAAVRAGLGQANVEVEGYDIIPDEADQLRVRVEEWLSQKVDLIVTVGGTGVGPRDRTVETIAPMLEREMPGIMEAARQYGQRRTPFAMLSRGVAGLIGETLVVTFPGSTRGARETLDALLVGVLHVFEVLRKVPHKHDYGAEKVTYLS